MHHRFDVKSFARLDNPERRKMLPPTETLQKVGLSPGDVVADVGCGIGYFTFPASYIVGLTGKVLAMDISDEMLEHVREKVHLSGAANIETIRIDNEQTLSLEDSLVDVALAFFVLHETEDAAQFIFSLNRILKPGGKLAIIDWKKSETPHGPPVTHRIDKETVISLLTEVGFDVKFIEAGKEYYGLLGSKPN